MDSKSKNAIIVVLVLIILILSGALLYLGKDKIFSKNVQNTNPNNQSSIQDEPTTKPINVETITDFSKAEKYYALISSTTNDTVYTKSKVTSANLSAEFMLLNAIKYTYKTDNSELVTVNAERMKKYAEAVYNTTINQLPNSLTQKDSQVVSDYKLNNEDYILNEVYGDKYGFSLPDNDVILFQKLEKSDDYVYLYDAIILNATFGESGCGEIRMPDGSAKQEITGGDTCSWTAKELYNKYPKYFSLYKHTFKEIGNEITYISSEPINK